MMNKLERIATSVLVAAAACTELRGQQVDTLKVGEPFLKVYPWADGHHIDEFKGKRQLQFFGDNGNLGAKLAIVRLGQPSDSSATYMLAVQVCYGKLSMNPFILYDKPRQRFYYDHNHDGVVDEVRDSTALHTPIVNDLPPCPAIYEGTPHEPDKQTDP